MTTEQAHQIATAAAMAGSDDATQAWEIAELIEYDRADDEQIEELFWIGVAAGALAR